MLGRRPRYLYIRDREILQPSVYRCWSHASRSRGQQAFNLYTETLIFTSETDNHTDFVRRWPVSHSFGCHIRHLLHYCTFFILPWPPSIPAIGLIFVFGLQVPLQYLS